MLKSDLNRLVRLLAVVFINMHHIKHVVFVSTAITTEVFLSIAEH